MSVKCVATFEINLPSSNLARTIYCSLKPELDAKTQITVEDNVITLSFKANTIATLRALTNSYLRWISTIRKTIDVLNKPPHIS